MEQSNSSNKAIVAIVVVALIAIAATAVIVLGGNKSESESAVTTSQSPSASPSSEPTGNQGGAFKSGSYSATGSYQTPGGRESIGVTVTLSGDGTITDANVKQNASGGEAVEYQEKFASGFKSQVVGKKVDDVSLTRVAGSSLTPNGFNSAIADIESQAKA